MKRDRANIAGLVVAAGYSSRMGGFKPLLPFGDSTVIEKAINCILDAGIEDIRVVVGWRADELRPLLDRLNVPAILNPHYDFGMYSSVVAGVNTLGPDKEAFFLLPADLPLVKSQTIQELVRTYLQSDAMAVYPRYDRRRGHPPLIATSCIERPSAYDLPGGLRSVLGKYADSAIDVDVDDAGILLDLDTPEDYQKALASLSQ